MNYAQALAHLLALGPELPASSPIPNSGQPLAPRRKFDLDHMRRLSAALGNPHSAVPSVLIAGTNGKGSTAATLASILASAGYRVGLYTSPHLTRVNERIQLARPVLPSEYGAVNVHGSDGALVLTPISDEDFAALYTRVDEAAEALVANGSLPWPPSFFERLTALAFLYFAGSAAASAEPSNDAPPAEIMVLEVGLGGRLDATNIVTPLFSVITDIALDHQDYLGETLSEIASEKAGILRQNGTLITLSQHPEANQSIGNAALALNVRGVDASVYLPPAQRNREPSQTLPWQRSFRNPYRLQLSDPVEPGELEVDSPLAGEHQQRNLALSIASAIELRNHYSYNITNTALAQGIRNTSWPGRLELLPPNLLLDVAHNPAGAWTLRAAISRLPQHLPRTLLFACLRDKDLTEMSRILFPLFDSSPGGDPERRHDHIVLAPIQSPRAASIDHLLEAAHALGIPAHAAPHVAGALAQAREITPPNGILIATGSVYLIGEVRALALQLHEVAHA